MPFPLPFVGVSSPLTVPYSKSVARCHSHATENGRIVFGVQEASEVLLIEACQEIPSSFVSPAGFVMDATSMTAEYHSMPSDILTSFMMNPIEDNF